MYLKNIPKYVSQPGGKQAFSKHLVHLNCPNQSPPDCRAQGLANGNAIIITQKALGLSKLSMKCWIIRERGVFTCV